MEYKSDFFAGIRILPLFINQILWPDYFFFFNPFAKLLPGDKPYFYDLPKYSTE